MKYKFLRTGCTLNAVFVPTVEDELDRLDWMRKLTKWQDEIGCEVTWGQWVDKDRRLSSLLPLCPSSDSPLALDIYSLSSPGTLRLVMVPYLASKTDEAMPFWYCEVELFRMEEGVLGLTASWGESNTGHLLHVYVSLGSRVWWFCLAWDSIPAPERFEPPG